MTNLKINLANSRLQRLELLDLLAHSKDFSLTLILAPAGCGKSTLLQQWRQDNPQLSTATLSLHRRHHDPVVFLRQFHELLAKQFSHINLLSINAFNARLEQADTLAQALLESFAQIDHEFYLIIDDFHYATAPIIQELFALLLADLPNHIHLILATRSYPDFSLSRLKLDDKLLVIDSHDLRLPTHQLNELCQALQQPQLTKHETDELFRLTEGWLAGIKLALLVRAKTGTLSTHNIQGSQPEIVDYFVNVVLNELSNDVREYLLASALFDKFDAKLMQHILPHLDSKLILQRIIQKGLFINLIDEHQQSYRYHPLFQKSLIIYLQQHHSNSYVEHLHNCAADYFLVHNDSESALYHSQHLQESDRFLQILETCCQTWFKEGQLLLILRWLDKVKQEHRLAYPNLALLQLAALIFSRQFSHAKYLLEVIKQHFLISPNPALNDILFFLDKVFNLFDRDNYEQVNDLHELDYQQCTHDIRVASPIFMARHYMLKGQCEEAIRQAHKGHVLLKESGHEYMSSFTKVIIILSERELGHILIARQMTQEFFEQYIQQENTPCWINAATCMAVSLYEQNRRDEAKILCEKLIMAVDYACATELVFYVYVTLARLQGSQNPHRASQLLLQLRRILRHGTYNRFLNQLLAEELSHALRSNKINQIKHIVEDYDLVEHLQAGVWQQAPNHYQETWVYGGIAAALYLRSKKQYDKALNILEMIANYLSNSQMRTRLLVVRANQIVIWSLQGQHSFAKQQLVELFNNVGLQCAIKTIFDEAPSFGELLRDAHEEGLICLPDIYLQLYHDVLYPSQKPVILPHKPSLEELTAKEYEVLALMQKGCSNKEIGDVLNISLSTTKWHIKNIFTKLNVANRSAAVSLSFNRRL